MDTAYGVSACPERATAASWHDCGPRVGRVAPGAPSTPAARTGSKVGSLCARLSEGERVPRVSQGLATEGEPGVGYSRVSQACSWALTISGCSSGLRWPHAGRTTSVAFGIAAAISSCAAGGVRASWRPARTRVGTGDGAERGPAVDPVQDCGLLAEETVPADLPGHRGDGPDQRPVGEPVRVNEQRQELADHGLELAPLRTCDHAEPPFARLGRIGARLGIQECQPEHPFRRPAHDLERDVAAHREAAEREALGCLGEHRLGHAGDAVGSGQIADPDRGDIAERRDLAAYRRSSRSSPGSRTSGVPVISYSVVAGPAERAAGLT